MHQTLEFLIRHGSWVLFTWVLAEQMGAPVPSVPILLATGALIGLHRESFAHSMMVVLVASGLADSFWYILGRQRGNSVLRLLCRISLEPDSCVSNTRDWFKRLDAWALVIAKFVPGLGAIAAPMAGLSKMQLTKFLAADSTGVLLWSFTYIGVGDLFREQLEIAADSIVRVGGSFFGIVAISVGLWIGWKFWKRRRFIRSLRIARVAPAEVFARLSDFVVLDLRSSTELQMDGMKVPGSIWFDRHELADRHLEIPRDRDVVLYCT
jgi:membrane protein DedA with SNARE-associated domain